MTLCLAIVDEPCANFDAELDNGHLESTEVTNLLSLDHDLKGVEARGNSSRSRSWGNPEPFRFLDSGA